jgi:hypothetical protein
MVGDSVTRHELDLPDPVVVPASRLTGPLIGGAPAARRNHAAREAA